jgi:pimeloyl-ACP methyl ester carboxylesterase
LILVSTSCGVGATPGQRGETLHALGTPSAGYPWPFPDPLGLLWQLLAFSSWSSIPFLGAIRAPTLVVCGTRDRVVPPINSKVLAGRIPDASLVMLPWGHDLQRSTPTSELARAVEHFLGAA